MVDRFSLLGNANLFWTFFPRISAIQDRAAVQAKDATRKGNGRATKGRRKELLGG
jgi:hypothetical protein